MKRLVLGGFGLVAASRLLTHVPAVRRELRSLHVLRNMGVKGTQTSGQG